MHKRGGLLNVFHIVGFLLLLYHVGLLFNILPKWCCYGLRQHRLWILMLETQILFWWVVEVWLLWVHHKLLSWLSLHLKALHHSSHKIRALIRKVWVATDQLAILHGVSLPYGFLLHLLCIRLKIVLKPILTKILNIDLTIFLLELLEDHFFIFWELRLILLLVILLLEMTLVATRRKCVIVYSSKFVLLLILESQIIFMLFQFFLI